MMSRSAFLLLLLGAALLTLSGVRAEAPDAPEIDQLLRSLTTFNNYLAGLAKDREPTTEALRDASDAVRRYAAELHDPELERIAAALATDSKSATLSWHVAAAASRTAVLERRRRAELSEIATQENRCRSLLLIAIGATAFGSGFAVLVISLRRLARERRQSDPHLPGTPDEPLPARVGYLRGEYERAATLYTRASGHRASLTIENRTLARDLDRKRLNPHTGLPLRELLDAHISERLAQRHQFTVIAIDLDEFKSVNDTYGHDAGDAALRHAGEILRHVTRPDDFLAHVSGDEFFVVASGPAYEAVPLATRLRDAVRTTPFVYQTPDGDVTPRIGLTVGIVDRAALPRDLRDPREATPALLKLADKALNQAKTIERGSVHMFDPDMDERAKIPDWEWIRRNLARIFWTRSDEARERMTYHLTALRQLLASDSPPSHD